MLNYLVDIYLQDEVTINKAPRMSTTLLHENVPANFVRSSGSMRYMAAGAGVPLHAVLTIPFYSDVTEMCVVDNIRTREAGVLSEQPGRYRVHFVTVGARRQHLELDLEALRDEA